jgi:hypothetical protein
LIAQRQFRRKWSEETSLTRARTRRPEMSLDPLPSLQKRPLNHFSFPPSGSPLLLFIRHPSESQGWWSWWRRRGRKRNTAIVIKSLLEQNRFHTIDNLSMAAIHSPKLRQGRECCGLLGEGPASTAHDYLWGKRATATCNGSTVEKVWWYEK